MTPREAPLPWQAAQWRSTWSQQVDRRLPHALLLCGPSGLGKQHFARALVARLLCRQPVADSEIPWACGQCRDCRQLFAGTHADWLQIQPETTGGPIKIDQIRELSEFLQRTSQRQGFKLVSLSPADQLNPHAANALLKTLEEPTPGSLLLLISTSPGRLPATVISRCQRLVFGRPETALAENWLRQMVPDIRNPELLLHLAEGAPLLAKTLGEGDRMRRRMDLFKAWQDFLADRQSPEALAEQCLAEDSARNLGWLSSWLRDMIRLKTSGADCPLVNDDLRSPLNSLATPVPPDLLFRRMDRLNELLRLLPTPVNQQLLLIAWLADFNRPGVSQPPDWSDSAHDRQ